MKFLEKYKIERRKNSNPWSTFTLWSVPTTFFLTGVAIDSPFISNKWLWWILIPVTFVCWIFMNWVIKKTNNV